MSLLNNLINKFQQLFSGSAAPSPDSGRAIQARQQLFVAILEACDDGVITADEMSDVRALQAKLGMSDAELNSIKIQVLQNLMDRVMEDNIVTEDEMDFIEQIEIDLQLGVADSLKIKTDIERVRTMYKSSNSVSRNVLDDDFDDNEYDNDNDDFDDDYQDDGINVGQVAVIATAVGASAILVNEFNNDSDLEDDPIDDEEIDEEVSEESVEEIETFSDES